MDEKFVSTAGRDVGRFSWEKHLRASGLDSTAKLVGFALATFADEDGSHAHPGAALLAESCSKSQTTVHRALARLRQAGFLRRTLAGRHAVRRHYADEFQLTIPSGHEEAPSTTSGTHSHGAPNGPTTNHPRPVDNPDHWSPTTTHQPITNPRPAAAARASSTSTPPTGPELAAVRALRARHGDAVDGIDLAAAVANLATRPNVRNPAGLARTLPPDELAAEAEAYHAARGAAARVVAAHCVQPGHEGQPAGYTATGDPLCLHCDRAAAGGVRV